MVFASGLCPAAAPPLFVLCMCLSCSQECFSAFGLCPVAAQLFFDSCLLFRLVYFDSPGYSSSLGLCPETAPFLCTAYFFCSRGCVSAWGLRSGAAPGLLSDFVAAALCFAVRFCFRLSRFSLPRMPFLIDLPAPVRAHACACPSFLYLYIDVFIGSSTQAIT